MANLQQKQVNATPVDFSKIRIGTKTIEDPTINLNVHKKVKPDIAEKVTILRAIAQNDYGKMRQISDYFYRTSGIYSRLCKYMAYMYKYDWIVTPYINSDSIKNDNVLDGFNKVLNYLDNFGVKRFLGETALKVIRRGAYYGYKIYNTNTVQIQQLPVRYCRSRFTAADGTPIVEFNMKFFDDSFKDTNQKIKMLSIFPPEFKKGYIAYKSGKLPPEFPGDSAGWFLLDPANTIKFNLNGQDFPAFISVIPAIIDLENAEQLDRKKQEQELLKILIQKLPMDKNGDLIFDPDEGRELHTNAVAMLARAIGVNVLTTYADVSVEDLADNSKQTGTDDLAKAKSAVYDEAGVSQMQFNTDGNLALEKSVLNDQASLLHLIQQFEFFLNGLIKDFNKKPKKVFYRVQILLTTIYNYKDLAKLYKENVQLGYSKMLPQIALGQSQSSILANAYFENDILDLVNVFVPPISSATMNADMLKNRTSSDGTTKQAGRPEKEQDQKSEKTIKNEQSKS